MAKEIALQNKFGLHVRALRLALFRTDRRYSLRQVAQRVGVEPSYLSRIENGGYAPLSEDKLAALARELGADPDVFLAMNGKIARDLQEIILERPGLFRDLLRALKSAPDGTIRRLANEVRDGEW